MTFDMLNSLVTEHRKITEICSIGNVPVDRGKLLIKNLEKFGILIQIEEDGEKIYKLTNRGYEWIGLYRLLKKTMP
jgi:predicted transcriptional regulator